MATKFGTFLRQSVPFVYLGGGICTGLAILYPNTVGLEHYKNGIAIHKPDGKEESVDLEIFVMVEEIKQNHGWSELRIESTETMSLFPSSSLEFNHLGSSRTKWGSYIGIPKYYLSKYQQDEEYLNELFEKFDIEPTSDAASNIRKSFNISDAAKKFALAKEMKLSKSYQIYAIAVGSMIAVSSFYLFPNIVSSLLPFPGVKFLSFLSLFPLFYFGSINFLKNSSRFVHKRADFAAANLSSSIAYGGLEYYSAEILREKEFHTKFSEKDERENILLKLFQQPWNASCLTLQERKENLKKFIETKYKDKQDHSYE